ncbi:MAG: hypothetical protein K0S74_512 [Chlamydiales bacterium]|jgi:hypothetical protein|nr:hypothetical protein [Chlamydiales bacterium]
MTHSDNKQKKKLCWNCEGSIPLKSELCPYCGANFKLTSPYQTQQYDYAKQLEDSLHLNSSKIDSIGDVDHSSLLEEQKNEEASNFPVDEMSEESQFTLIPLLFFLPGSTLTFFALLLLLFSRHGTLRIEWDTSYWFLYLLLGSTLLGLGWNKLKNISR